MNLKSVDEDDVDTHPTSPKHSSHDVQQHLRLRTSVLLIEMIIVCFYALALINSNFYSLCDNITKKKPDWLDCIINDVR